MRFRYFVPLIVLLSLSVAACGGRANAVAARTVVAVDSGMVTGFETFSTSLDARCDADQIPAEACRILNRLSVPMYDAADAVHKQLASGRPLDDLGIFVATLQQAAAGVKAEIDTLTVAQGRDILLDILSRLRARYVLTSQPAFTS